jgi:dTDP-4-dehydrorhamnose reductase
MRNIFHEKIDMKILVTGAAGQLGKQLMQSIPADCEVIGMGRDVLDISDLNTVSNIVSRTSPDIIINAAAYTAVDRAETEPEKALAVNAQGVANLAEAALAGNIRLIHISTDFIFDGKQSLPYQPDSPANPLNVYGASKWAGEQRITASNNLSYVIVRTAWVYSAHGNNFVKTILRLLKERQQLAVITDQIGSPTWTGGLAKGIWAIAGNASISGMVNWSDAGVASWYDFAVAIQEEAINIGLITRSIPITAIPSSDYPLPARRPHFSVLDNSETWQLLGFRADHWRQSLRKMLYEIKEIESQKTAFA